MNKITYHILPILAGLVFASSTVFMVPSVLAATRISSMHHRLIVTLKQAPSSATSKGVSPAVPPIYGTTTLRLPLYPGMSPTSQNFPLAFEETPISWYVRTAKAEKFVAPVAMGSLEAWYKHQMKVMGYHQTGSSSSGNTRTGEKAQGFAYQPAHPARGHQIEVDISFERLGSQKTLMEYFATDLVIPKRPATSDLPQYVTSINGRMTVYGTKVQVFQFHITNPKKIKRLVTSINSLTRLIQGMNPGGPAIWGTATLTFYPLKGKAITVNVDTDSVSVNGVGLMDAQGNVWKTIEQIMEVKDPN